MAGLRSASPDLGYGSAGTPTAPASLKPPRFSLNSYFLLNYFPYYCRYLSIYNLLSFYSAVVINWINVIDFSFFSAYCIKILVLYINLHNLVQTFFSQLMSLSLFSFVAPLQPMTFHQNLICKGDFGHTISIESFSNSLTKFIFPKDPAQMSLFWKIFPNHS